MFMTPVERTFRQTWTLRIVSILPVIIFVLITWAAYEDEKKANEFLIGFDLVWVVIAAFAWYAGNKVRLDVHSEGLMYFPAFGQPQEFLWNDIVDTRYAQNNVNVAAHFGLIGYLIAFLMKGSTSNQAQLTLKLLTSDQRKLTLTSNFKDADDVIRMVFEKVNPRLFADAQKELQSSGSVKFGDVTVTQDGMQWKSKDLVPYSSFKKFVLDGPNLRVQAEGKWLDAITVNCFKLPNVFVLIDLVNNLRNPGKPYSDPLAVASGNTFQGASFKS